MTSASDAIRVLHVDDDPAFAEMAGTFLEREDDRFAVETATNAADGVEQLTANAFDCVVSDYEMPGRDGIEFLDDVRAQFPDLPFILYTGTGNEEVASDAIASGVTDYLQKQTGSQQYELLANRILNAVEQYRASQRADELERVRALVTDVNQALVRASSRTEIERRVCDIVASVDSYRFAWIGDPDPATQRVTVRSSAGVERDYLETIEITTDEGPTGAGPTGRAVRTRDIAVQQNIREADAFDPWLDDALESGYRSSAAVPLVCEDALYGVLNVYAGRPSAFDEAEQDVLSELGSDVAYALHHQAVERSLQWERDRFQHLVDEIESYAIFMMDAEGRIATWNEGAERIKGYATEEIVGKHYETFFPEEAVEEGTPEQLLDRAESADGVTGRGWRVRDDGDRFWADFTLTALYDDSGDLRGYAKVTQDLTEQLRHERQLQRQNERLEEFASIVSHDLRNPLNVAAGRVDLAREETDSEHLDDAASAIERSLTLVDDLLAIARDGEQAGAVETVSLSDTATWCWQNIRSTEATLTVDVDGPIRAIPSRLKQLLDNLLANAVEHGGDSITVGKLEDGFYVADDGDGIPAEEREYVFDNGYSTSDGTGLGLDIVRDCADAQGWEVHASDSETGGARFEITGVEFVESDSPKTTSSS